MGIVTWIIGRFASVGLPEAVRKPLAWVTLAVAAFALLWAAKAAYDASVIDEHEQSKIEGALDAHNDAADQRADDAIDQAKDEEDRNDAINAAPTGGTLSPAEHALNCERLRKLGRSPAGC